LTNPEPTADAPAWDTRPLSERLEDLARELLTAAGPNRREVTKDEIDALWGHEDMTPAPEAQPIGPLVGAHPARRPERVMLEGRWITLAPLDAEKHAEALYAGSNGDGVRESVWTYLPYGPFANLASFAADIELKARSVDPQFFAVIDNGSGRAVGYQSLMRIDPANRVIEVGHVMYTPAMQRTARATEAQYLFAQYVFDALGNRRYEWKCDNLNAPSKRAAGRFGLTFEGVFRQHMIVKGRNRDTAWFAMLDGEWPARKAAYERWLSPDNFDADGRQRQRLSELMPKAPAGDHGGDADVLARRRNADL
jgi:RimJ/RimL family protein N-acetyltransferase